MAAATVTQTPSSRAKAAVADWSLLNPELLFSIAERLDVDSIVCLRAVCSWWAWVFGRPRRGSPLPPPYRATLVSVDGRSNIVPWMLLPNEHGEDSAYCSFRCLDSLDDDGCILNGGGDPRRIISISPLPEMFGRRCVGSSPDGWLVTLDLSLQPRILNPLTREEFPLPSLLTIPTKEKAVFDADGSVLQFYDYEFGYSYTVEEFRDHFVRRIVLTAAPPTGIAAAIYGFRYGCTYMALARPGDACWAVVPKARGQRTEQFQDAVYHEKDRCIYAVTRDGSVAVVPLRNYNSKRSSFLLPPLRTKLFSQRATRSTPYGAKHLVFLEGALLQIWRTFESYYEDDPFSGDEDEEFYGDDMVRVETISVEVMRFDPDRRELHTSTGCASCWVPILNLGNYSIFVGCNHAVALRVNGEDDCGLLRRNCVYFTDDSRCGPTPKRKQFVQDTGVFDLEKKTFHRFFPFDCKVNWPPPVWFFPAQLRFALPQHGNMAFALTI